MVCGDPGRVYIDFTLTKRAGHETLSTDDIANYHLNSEAFDFVFLVEPKPNSESDKSLLFVGAEGESRLKKLMNAAK